MSVADAQRKLRDLGLCSLAYRPGADNVLVFCGEPLEDCPLHSVRALRLAEVRRALKSLEEYEDCHAHVNDGGLCLSDVLEAGRKKVTGWEATA